MDKGYECHLTFDRELAPLAESICPYGWKFSKIDGDPVLGKKLYCYWTSWNAVQGVMEDEMRSAMNLASNNGLRLVRAKIEHIIYDQRY